MDIVKYLRNEAEYYRRKSLIKTLNTAADEIEKLRNQSSNITPRWRPISTAPLDRTLILVRGDSGYTTYRFFVVSAYYDAEFRSLSPWLDVTNTCLEDYGFVPTEWMPIPE